MTTDTTTTIDTTGDQTAAPTTENRTNWKEKSEKLERQVLMQQEKLRTMECYIRELEEKLEGSEEEETEEDWVRVAIRHYGDDKRNRFYEFYNLYHDQLWTNPDTEDLVTECIQTITETFEDYDRCSGYID